MSWKATSLVACAGLVALSTWLLAYSGWRGRILNPDLVPPANAAIEFVQNGKLPEKSCLSSTCGYNPPGTSWLLLPGIMMFRDVRLFEAPATLALHVLTIAGLIVIGAVLGSTEAGLLSAVLYSLGPRGLFFASSLWPRSHPAFSVWIIAFLLLYLKSRRSYYFGLAILTFGLGLFVFMEMAPMGIAFPLALMFRRSGRWLAAYTGASMVVLIAVWAPYLRFEGTRNYDDLQRILTRGTCPIVTVPSYNWCSPSRAPVYVTVSNRLVTSTISPPEVSVPTTMPRRFAARLIGNVSPSFAMNWRDAEAGTGFPFLTSLRSLIFVLGLLTVVRRCTSKLTLHSKWHASPKLFLLGGIVCILLGGSLSPSFIGLFTRSGTYYDLIKTYSREALWLGLYLLAMAGFLALRGRKDGPEAIQENPAGYQLLIGTYMLSWIFWALIGGDYRYFFWLWPMQALIMGLGICSYLGIFCAEKIYCRRRWALLAAVVALMAANGSFVARASSWAKESWPGEDDPVIASLDHIAHEKHPGHDRTVKIVYEIAVREYIPISGALDRMYFPGMEYDLYLREKYGLENEIQCVGVPTRPPDYLIRDEDRRLKSGIGEFVWFDVDSVLTKNMNVVNRQGSITLLAADDRMDSSRSD